MACWRRTRTKSGKYGPRELCSESYMSLGRLYVPREVDLADRTRGAQRPEFPWAVFSEFRPRPPPAGQYVLTNQCRLTFCMTSDLGRVHTHPFEGGLNDKLQFFTCGATTAKGRGVVLRGREAQIDCVVRYFLPLQLCSLNNIEIYFNRCVGRTSRRDTI